jgi:hypothetical protein
MEPGLIQAMGSLSLADKAKARASKAYKAMTEEQKAERRAKDAERAKAKRAATKDQPKPEVPAEVADAKKEKEKLRKQKARAAAKASGAGADPERGSTAPRMVMGLDGRPRAAPEGLELIELNGKDYWLDPKTRALYQRPPRYIPPPGYRVAEYPRNFILFHKNGLPYVIDPDTMYIYSNFEDPDRGIGLRDMVGVVGQLEFTTIRADTEAEQEDIDYHIAVKEQEREEAREWARILREEAEEEARPGREAAEMERADREFARERRRALAPQVRTMAIASLKSLEGSYLMSPEAIRAGLLKPEAERGKEQMEQFINEGSWYDPARGFRRDEFGNPVEADWRKYSRDTRPINPETRPGIDVSLTLARMFGGVPAEPAKPLAPKAKTEEPVNVDALTPTHKKHIKSIAKEVGAVLPLTGKGDLTAAFMREVRAYFNAMTPAEWGKAGIDDHIRAFFSQKSK